MRAGLERDPATLHALELVLTSPGLWAIWGYRVAHVLWGWGWRTVSRVLSNLFKLFTGIEIHPGAVIGRRFVIDHGVGVVIGETAIVGDDVLMYHQVTLGSNQNITSKRHPTVSDNVVLGAGAKVIGNILIGKGAAVGANAVVTKPVPAGAIVVGTNRVIRSHGPAANEFEI